MTKKIIEKDIINEGYAIVIILKIINKDFNEAKRLYNIFNKDFDNEVKTMFNNSCNYLEINIEEAIA